MPPFVRGHGQTVAGHRDARRGRRRPCGSTCCTTPAPRPCSNSRGPWPRAWIASRAPHRAGRDGRGASPTRPDAEGRGASRGARPRPMSSSCSPSVRSTSSRSRSCGPRGCSGARSCRPSGRRPGAAPCACTSGRRAPTRAHTIRTTNLLRATTEAMSAAIGGADTVLVEPHGYDAHLAINVQRILAEEAHLDAVADPAGGSYYVEAITDALARAAWTQFQALEAGARPRRPEPAGFQHDRIRQVPGCGRRAADRPSTRPRSMLRVRRRHDDVAAAGLVRHRRANATRG